MRFTRWMHCLVGFVFVVMLVACGEDSPVDETVAGAGPTQVNESQYTTTGSGLKFYDIQVGTGAAPNTGQTVVVHYSGWLQNGTKFDSSVDRGQPFNFILGVGQVIRGWDEGVATMRVGGKRQLVLPAALAYGSQGSGRIPPNATLIFDVELLQIIQ